MLFFFFQAEDGIRDYKVTGVQTCALPIYEAAGIDLGGAGRIRGTQVVRRDDQAVGAARPKLRQRDRTAARARHHAPCEDRKSTRLNSSHLVISYAVFCLKKKKRIATISYQNISDKQQLLDHIDVEGLPAVRASCRLDAHSYPSHLEHHLYADHRLCTQPS